MIAAVKRLVARLFRRRPDSPGCLACSHCHISPEFVWVCDVDNDLAPFGTCAEKRCNHFDLLSPPPSARSAATTRRIRAAAVKRFALRSARFLAMFAVTAGATMSALALLGVSGDLSLWRLALGITAFFVAVRLAEVKWWR